MRHSFHVTYRTTDKVLAKHFASTVADGQILVLLAAAAAAKANLIAWIVTLVHCVTQRNVSCNLSGHF